MRPDLPGPGGRRRRLTSRGKQHDADGRLVWVTAGAATLTVAGERREIGPGEGARFSGGLPHSYANHGTGPVRMTMVVVIPPVNA